MSSVVIQLDHSCASGRRYRFKLTAEFTAFIAHIDGEEVARFTERAFSRGTSCIFVLRGEADSDGDGYGNPGHITCLYPQRDCNDEDPGVNPSIVEDQQGAPNFGDGTDNDCDRKIDWIDSGCCFIGTLM